MKNKVTCISIMVLALLGTAFMAQKERWIYPRCVALPFDLAGPFVKLGDGSLLTVEGNATRISKDGGKTWSAPRTIYNGPKPGTPRNGLLLKTRDAVIVLVYSDRDTFKWGWDDAKGVPHEDVRLDVWTIRSLDEGKTWVDRQKILDGYCGALIDIIQTTRGHIVVPIQPMLRDPARHATYTAVSADNGKTWKRSNIIDLGGYGHHDGAMEATLAELQDGRLWMLLRTTWDKFWEAYSDDHGLSWRVIQPTNIDASSSPGYLMRLASGRLVLVWNRLYRQGENTYSHLTRKDFDAQYPMRKDFKWYSERTRRGHPESWQREELSIAFSEDDGKTWTQPVVIARQKDVWFSYSHVFEREPGLLWIFAGPLRVSLREADFLVLCRSSPLRRGR